jgi:endonuclease/exonuclease/phosphatase family metal-dependent hydrolase
MDGRAAPDRIARVIARYQPDIVALQEVDVRHVRTGGIDQTEHIAGVLGMTGQFHPAMRMKDGDYGIAIMSRYPMQLMKADLLPRRHPRPHYQPRAAMWVSVDVAGRPLQVINTHLSLWPDERLQQIEALLGREWLRHPRCTAPEILCGDFNAWHGSPVYRQVSHVLQDAQRAVAAHVPRRTWVGRYPMACIDHVFVGSRVRVAGIEVPTTELDRMASDHLPLIVDLELPQAA